MGEVYLKSGETARMIGVSVGTLGKWHEKGIFVPAQVFPSGRRRYTLSQIQEFIAQHENQSMLEDADDEVYMSSREVMKYAGITLSMLNSLESGGHLLPRRRLPTNGKRFYAKTDVDAFLARISTR